MTDDEAKQFRHELIDVRFPSLGEWFDGLRDKNATWRVWCEVLNRYSFDECMSVIRRWSDGTLEPFKPYERERVHLFIQAIILRDRDRLRGTAREAEPESFSTARVAPMGPVIANCLAMASEGVSEAEIQKYIDRECPTSPAYEQPRYKCLACLDRGLVEIWHPAEVARFVNGLKPKPTCLCTVQCSCSDPQLDKRYQRDVKYDPTKHCRVAGWDSMEQKREALTSWLAERRKIENHPNYSSEFKEFAIWALLATVIQISG